jgi:2-polyprenyl-3-methyl-5-hydroxy-6-metoxy-1,4-benzoquinol methylase
MASLLSLSSQISYYDARWSGFEHANLYSLERSLFILQAILAKNMDRPRICDLGSGAGWLAGILSAFGPTLGVELSPHAVEQARERYPTASFLCADATRWQPERGGFDILVSQEVLEHIEDKSAYLKVARQALRTGGYLLLTTPNLRVLKAIPDAERKAIWETQPLELPVDRKELNRLLVEAGFKVIRTSSAVCGAGRMGFHRIVNSTKLQNALAVLKLKQAWQKMLLKTDFGMYLLTVARAR